MIEVTRFNGKKFYINSDLIEFIEATPDTVITTTSGKKVVVTETVEEVIEQIINFKSKIYCLKDKQLRKAE
ncbi:MAG: flagellar FlbD family protein [Clostridiaceae bacterium]|nr:flagellar FlbD family protein [Clostridiaceae bacterium]